MLSVPVHARQARFAVLMLIVGTVFWGMGFVWAKDAGEAANRAAGLGDGSALGPVVVLGIRFTIAALLWLAIFPRARRGWSRRTILYGLPLGLVMCGGLVLQHLGLDRTSEAVAAFLTNLTVVLVPLMVAAITFRRPGTNLIIACGVALAGIFLLAGFAGAGSSGSPGATQLMGGELLVCAAAVLFSVEIILINALIPRDDVFRLTAAMFLVCGLACLGCAAMLPGFAQLDASQLLRADAAIDIALLTVLCTLVSFGLMNCYQPQVDPTRAAIVYLFEPIVAAAFAWAIAASPMTAAQLAGAALILLANGVAEVRWGGKRNVKDEG
jgi:drug/metabolite transporter (DMT)-like permease